MKKHILGAVAGVLALGFGVSIANAAAVPCVVPYEHPLKAASFKANLVQSFVSCGNTGGATPNATTEGGSTPTCYPAVTLNEKAGSPPNGWHWGPKATASISFKAGKNKIYPTALNTDPNAVDLYIQVKASDIRNGTGALVDGPSGKVAALSRATLIDRAENKLMTVIDFPTQFTVQAIKGKASRKISATVILNALNNPALPACTTIELVQVIMKDANGNPFAVLGNFLP
jgi:hypothetical protein